MIKEDEICFFFKQTPHLLHVHSRNERKLLMQMLLQISIAIYPAPFSFLLRCKSFYSILPPSLILHNIP